MGEMKAIKGFIILDNGRRLAISRITTYDKCFYENLPSVIYFINSNNQGDKVFSKYTLEEIDEAIIKAQL